MGNFIENNREFSLIIKDMVYSEKVQMMADIKHHSGGVSCLEHCIFVSYISFLLARRLGLDRKAAARGGLLHDLYLSDCSDLGRARKLFAHPDAALKNASEEFYISKIEEDIIYTHMWPLTLTRLPRHAESYVVGLADKICAALEMSRIYANMNTRERLRRRYVVKSTDI